MINVVKFIFGKNCDFTWKKCLISYDTPQPSRKSEIFNYEFFSPGRMSLIDYNFERGRESRVANKELFL